MPTNINLDKKLGFINGTKIILPSGPVADFSTKSLSFDGTDDYVSTSEVYSELDGATKATFSFWIKFDFNQNSFPIWVRSASDRSMAAVVYTTGMLRLQVANSSYYATTGTGVLQSDTWHHVLMCVDLSLGYSQRGKIFVDGQDETTGNNINVTSIPSSPYPLYIGTAYLGSGITNAYGGLMDEIAIWAGQDLRSSVATIYNNGKPADLTSLNPTSWYRAGENSTFAYPQILMPEDTNKNKLSKYSLNFDGTGYVDCGDPNEFSFGNTKVDSRFSISTWVYMNDATQFRIVSKMLTNATAEYAFFTSAADQLYFVLYTNNTSNRISRYTSATLTSYEGQWIHLAATYDGSGSSTGLKTYLNGNRVDDTTSNVGVYSAMNNTNAPLTIGRAFQSNANGKIDEAAIFPVELTQSDVESIYNSGIPNDISSYSPVGYWKLGEEAKFTNNWLVPNSALSNFSKYSFNFDGIDDYINLASRTQNFTDFSLSFWVVWGGGNYKTIIGSSVSQGGILYAIVQAGGQIRYIDNTSGWTILSDTISDGNWHHILITYDSTANTLKGYTDGSLSVTKTSVDPINTTNSHSFDQIGARLSGSVYNQKIDEIAVWGSVLDPTQVTAIYNGGKPKDLSGLSPIHWWRMGEEATYDGTTSQFTIPDQGSGGNNGTSSNTMLLETLVGDAPQYYGGGISDSMDIFDRVGDAPNSENNTVSFNMEEADIVEDTP